MGNIIILSPTLCSAAQALRARVLHYNSDTCNTITFERQKVTESTCWVTCATGTPRAVAALNSLAPSICTLNPSLTASSLA